MNFDGAFTVTDVGLWFGLLWDWAVWLYLLPGNAVVSFLLNTPHPVITFFEVSKDWYDGWLVGLVSTVVWGVAALVVYFVKCAFNWLETRLEAAIGTGWTNLVMGIAVFGAAVIGLWIVALII